jgi:hypothetical protein
VAQQYGRAVAALQQPVRQTFGNAGYIIYSKIFGDDGAPSVGAKFYLIDSHFGIDYLVVFMIWASKIGNLSLLLTAFLWFNKVFMWGAMGLC